MSKRRLVVIALLAGICLLAAAVVVIAWQVADTQAAIGLIGILVGAAIPTAASLVLARQARDLQLSTAALDKRLAAHQEAYAHWHKILEAVHQKDEIGRVVRDAQEWWRNNCLYLDAASREAFRACLLFAVNHRDLLESPRSKETTEMILNSWKMIIAPSKTLVEGVALPSLGRSEYPPNMVEPK